MCEFNMAVTVREGHSGNVNLTNAKYWLTGDIGDKWGTEKKGTWVVVSFDPKTTKEQRDALAPIILKTYGLEWSELKVQEAPIEVRQSGDIVEAQLADGKEAYLKLRREQGADGKGVVLKNVKYFNAVENDGFELYRSLEHRADLEGHQFSYSDRKAFLITIVSEEPKGQEAQVGGQQIGESERVSRQGGLKSHRRRKGARRSVPLRKECVCQRAYWVLRVDVPASQLTAALRKNDSLARWQASAALLPNTASSTTGWRDFTAWKNLQRWGFSSSQEAPR